MDVTWLLCDLQSGIVIAELPIITTSDLERTISTATTISAQLNIHDDACPTNWAQLIDPLTNLFVVCFDDRPVIGFVHSKDTSGDPTVALSLESLEAVTNAVYVRDHDFSEDVDDEADAAAALLSDVVVPSFGFTLDVTQTGHSGDHSYSFEEDRLVGDALADLAQAAHGPEWTIRLSWQDAKHQRVVKTIQIGPQIGSTTPTTVFENHHLKSRQRVRDSSNGNRAVHVIATSDGSGDDRPMSDPAIDQAALDRGVPQWEARVNFAAIDDTTVLDRLAAAGLTRRRQALTTWPFELDANAPGCPVVGRDFDAGDTVLVQADPTEDDPMSWYGPGRIIGWSASLSGSVVSSVTPTFWSPPEEDEV